MSEAVETAAGRYSTLEADRTIVLQRAREASKLTLPSLIPMDGVTSSSTLPTPYQSVGARGVNNLAAKLLLSLFPPNQPFFRFVIGDFDLQKIINAQSGAKEQFQMALSMCEREVQSYIEQNALRVGAFEAIKHMIVGGNALIYIRPDGSMRVFHLKHFVVRRDCDDNVIEIITKEHISPDAVPEGVTLPKTEEAKPGTDKNITLYTWIKRTKKNWTVHQEVAGQTVPGSDGTYPLDRSPWLALRWTKVDGEDYGRGFVEEYQGDLQSLEGLSRALVEGATQAAKVVWLVKPNGQTKAKDIAESANGSVRGGNADDVKALQLEKQMDFRVAKDTADDIERRLSYAFLLNSAIQRDAERVTSAEIRYMAQELDASLGGLYATQSQEFQLPLVKVLMAQLQRQKRLPDLPKGAVKPTIVTGLEALGRGNDLDKLNQFIGELTPLGPQVIQQYLRVDTYMSMVAASIGIDTGDLIKTQDEIQQEQQAMQQQAMLQQAVPHLAKAAADGTKEIAVHHATAGQAGPPAQPPSPSVGPQSASPAQQ